MTDLVVNIERKRLFPGYDGITCKDVPNLWANEQGVFLSWGITNLKESDVMRGGEMSVSRDNGNTFSTPEPTNEIRYREGNVEYSYFGCVDGLSKKYGLPFSMGVIKAMTDGKLAPSILHECYYVFRDVKTGKYVGKPKLLPFPIDSPSIAPHGQPIEFENGDFLFTFYFADKILQKKLSIIAIRYSFNGEEFKIKEVGAPISNPSLARGLCEPSVVNFNGKYYMTIRTDEKAMFATSVDGLNYTTPIDFVWDNGEQIGSENTHQRWIRHESSLYLVYTRKGANNDHVFRHRAPLFLAEFDTNSNCLIKDTEIILVPELGAGLAGMIAVWEISKNESYVAVAEVMQYENCEKYGSDNSIWLVKVSSKS